jgi:BirA family biotin operon repressor/biotin-[acetyl-CoA-carboxylase] ligase
VSDASDARGHGREPSLARESAEAPRPAGSVRADGGRADLPREIAEALASRRGELGDFGRTPVYLPITSSTNDRAAELAAAGAHEGTWVIADEQSAGRGRRGRVWASPPGAGLYLSVVFRPQPAQRVDATALLTLMAGVAAVRGVRAASGLQPTLKWPNDLVIEPGPRSELGSEAGASTGSRTSRFRKLAGILAEASATGGELQFIILGIGINLTPAAYPPDVAARATSIEGELGRPADRALVLVETLAALAHGRRQLLDGHTADVLRDWRALAPSSSGRRVRWQQSGGPTPTGQILTGQTPIGQTPIGQTQTGTTAGIDDTGALLVKTSTGLERIIAGEVEWE